MAIGKKISQLPAVTTCALTDIFPEVQPATGGVTYKATLAQLQTLYQATPWPASAGGTGVASPTAHSLPVAEGSSPFTFLGPLTNGQLLIGSTGVDPVAATLTSGSNITVTNGAGSISIAVTGIIPASEGGTGVASPTANTLPVANGASAYNFVGPLTNGQLLIGSTGTTPVAAAITAGGSNISVTNGAGSIAIAFINGSQIAGTTTNDNASSGNIGQVVSNTVGIGAPLGLTSATPTNLTSISVPAGDWTINGQLGTVPAAGTTTTDLIAGINSTSATMPNPTPTSSYGRVNPTATANQVYTINLTPCRFSLSTTTTIYLVVNCTFAVSTLSAWGWISARRVR